MKIVKVVSFIILTAFLLVVSGCDVNNVVSAVAPEFNEGQFTVYPASINAGYYTNGSLVFSGGVPPYKVLKQPHAISGSIGQSYYSFYTLSTGTDSVVFQDCSTPPRIFTVPINIGTLKATPFRATLEIGEQQYFYLDAGRQPYTIKAGGDKVATAAISSTKLTVTGLVAGKTEFKVVDAASPVKSVIIPVQVVNPLRFSSDTITITAGESARVTISGGTPPYQIDYSGNSLIENAIVRDQLMIEALRHGACGVRVYDNSYPNKSRQLYVKILQSAGLLASSSEVKIRVGETATVSVFEGRGPYSVVTKPDTTIASITSMSDLSIIDLSFFGKSPGRTSVKVSDASKPEKSLTVFVTVESNDLTTPGSISIKADQFSQEFYGILNQPYGSDGAAGYFYKTYPSDNSFLLVRAKKTNSSNGCDDLSLYVMMKKGELRTGKYTFPDVYLFYARDHDPRDTFILRNFYSFDTLFSVTITTVNDQVVSGYFSGTGLYAEDYTVITNKKLNIFSAEFTVPVTRINESYGYGTNSGLLKDPLPEFVKKAVRKRF